MTATEHALILQNETAALRAEKDRYYQGEQVVQCTCAPPHSYQMREAKCPEYVRQLEERVKELELIAEKDRQSMQTLSEDLEDALKRLGT